MDREERWFDISVRRPDEAISIRAGEELPEPTETQTSVHRPAFKLTLERTEIQLMLGAFRSDSAQAAISSGLAAWEAADHLCDHLLALDWTKGPSDLRLIELGSGGLGKCGLLAHHLIRSLPANHRWIFSASTVLTDGDTNALQLLRKNIAQNTDPADRKKLKCKQLLWGREEAKKFLWEKSNIDIDRGYNVMIGSDLLYTNKRSIDPLFDTVDVLLSATGRFFLAHNEAHGILVGSVVWASSRKNLFCEVRKQDGNIYVLCFRRPLPGNVNRVLKRYQTEIGALKSENCNLKSDKGYLERKCRALDRRCASLRRGEGLPESILLSLDEDHICNVASFLTSKCLGRLALISKHFGLKSHKIGYGPVSFVERIAHNMYEHLSKAEKEALFEYGQGMHGTAFGLYGELLELRKPLKFDRILGKGIAQATEDESRIVAANLVHPLKRAPGTNLLFTAVCNHVMRAGRHFVTFSSPQGGNPLWFGVIRPWRNLESEIGNGFSPFEGKLRGGRRPGWGKVHCCAYTAASGQCQWTDWGTDWDTDSEGDWGSGGESEDGNESESESEDDREGNGDKDNGDDHGTRTRNWDGMQPFSGGKIGMLLDYEERTLSVFKDNIKLGVMKTGLSGEYSWMVTVGEWISSSWDGIKIERVLPPPDGSTAESGDYGAVKKKLRKE